MGLLKRKYLYSFIYTPYFKPIDKLKVRTSQTKPLKMSLANLSIPKATLTKIFILGFL